MEYDVHIYAIFRVKVCGVKANTQKEAISKAVANVNLHEAFSNVQVPSTYVVETEYAEDIESFLVDEIGDEFYARTRSYDATTRLIPPVNKPKQRKKKS